MNKTYGIGKQFIGIWIGYNTIDNEKSNFFRISLFPFDIYFILNDVSFCFRIHLFHSIKLSSIIEVG